MSEPQKTGQERIDEIAGGYRASQILLTANRLRLFQELEPTDRSAEELAVRIESDPRATRVLCDALVSLGILEKSFGRYRNSQLAKEYLLPGGNQSKVAHLVHAAKLYERWRNLFDVVKTGRPAADDSIDPRLVGDRTVFAEAMADTARALTGRIAVLLNLSGASKMLDIGGGPGLYSIAFLHRYPQLHAVIVDNSETLSVARTNIKKAGLSERTTLLAMDAFQGDLGKGYDFILLSNLVHIYSAEENRGLLTRCGQALRRGGHICIKDFILDSDRTSPQWAALFAVNMLVNTERGDCYTLEEIDDWFTAAGLERSKILQLGAHSRLVTAVKP